MESLVRMYHSRFWLMIGSLVLSLTACTSSISAPCASGTRVGRIDSEAIAHNDTLTFSFPLGNTIVDEFFGPFAVAKNCPPNVADCENEEKTTYHSAEDYRSPAGTPVYAMADGQIRFSGKEGGYGWLIIIDHPMVNLYSLYGHLSPSRWKLPAGSDVKKGDLIAYLGDSDENGGSREQPLTPHLHFGIRAGQMADYPSRGEWRYQAGWIHFCPQELGWMQPSIIILEQDIPVGGYKEPAIGVFTKWGQEILLSIIYMSCGVGLLLFAIRRNKRALMIASGLLVIVAGIVFLMKDLLRSPILIIAGVVLSGVGLYCFTRKTNQ